MPLPSIVMYLVAVLFATETITYQDTTKPSQYVDYDAVRIPEKVNILWIVAEDLSPVLPSYGDSTIETPNLSRLAAEGITYTNMYTTNGVCAPSRAAIALGMHPIRIGADHMRNGPWSTFEPTRAMIERSQKYLPEGIPVYEAMPPPGAHMHGHYLRTAGYYCTNNPKEDYQVRREMTAWDESSRQAHWKNRKPGQPFFAIFNLNVTHESMIWRKAKDSLQVPGDLDVPVPPYLPDTETTRRDIRRLYSNIKLMDARVGEILSELESANLLDSTIIFWYSDHGGPFPRQKRTLFDSGLRAPMFVRLPGKQQAGTIDTQLLSFLDFTPTLLSVVNMPVPHHMDGRPWLGSRRSLQKRRYVYAASDRYDQEYDQIRAVRDYRYKYLRNTYPDRPHYLDIKFRLNMDCMQEMLTLRDKGLLDPQQQRWFDPKDGPEELYDTFTDPYELYNLADDPAYSDKLSEMRHAMDQWLASFRDLCAISESELINIIWPDGVQPKTQPPAIDITTDGMIRIHARTEGAVTGYQWLDPGASLSGRYTIFSGKPIKPVEGKRLAARAHRLGYLPSETVFTE